MRTGLHAVRPTAPNGVASVRCRPNIDTGLVQSVAASRLFSDALTASGTIVERLAHRLGISGKRVRVWADEDEDATISLERICELAEVAPALFGELLDRLDRLGELRRPSVVPAAPISQVVLRCAVVEGRFVAEAEAAALDDRVDDDELARREQAAHRAREQRAITMAALRRKAAGR